MYATDEGDSTRRRKRKEPIPTVPRVVTVTVRGRVVVEIAFDQPGMISPGSVAWRARPEGVSGPEREAAAGYVVRVAGLDPKIDHDRIYEALWGDAPKPSN